MISYHYKCNECGDEFEIEQSIKAKPLKKCNKCKKYKLERVIYGGTMVSVDNITTVGQLAEKNYKKNKSEIEENISKKNIVKRDQTKRKIMAMNDKQKERFIMEGHT